jgi:hypothetical protein
LSRLETLSREVKESQKKEGELTSIIEQMRANDLQSEEKTQALQLRLEQNQRKHIQDLQEKQQEKDELKIKIKDKSASLKYQILQIQNELSTTKGQVKKITGHHLNEILRSELKSLLGKANAKHCAAVDLIQRQWDVKVQQFNKIPQAELHQIQQDLKLSLEKNDRLQQELSHQKVELTNHFNHQKNYTQDLQKNCIVLEDRLNTANRDIMEIAEERDRSEVERRKWQEKYMQDTQVATALEQKLMDQQIDAGRKEVIT